MIAGAFRCDTMLQTTIQNNRFSMRLPTSTPENHYYPLFPTTTLYFTPLGSSMGPLLRPRDPQNKKSLFESIFDFNPYSFLKKYHIVGEHLLNYTPSFLM